MKGVVIAIVVGLFVGGIFGSIALENHNLNNVIIKSTTGATNVGKVNKEVLAYRLKAVDASDIANQQTTGFMELGVVSPSEFIVPFLEKALGDNFSYDLPIVKSTAIIIETYVIYTGDKGTAQKLIDSRSLVFHTGTTIKEIVADVTQHTKNVNELYKAKHTYLQ